MIGWQREVRSKKKGRGRKRRRWKEEAKKGCVRKWVAERKKIVNQEQGRPRF